MKTNKIRLLATMVTLAAVILSTSMPATAQRRQTQNNRTETRVQKSNNTRSNGRTQVKSQSKKVDTRKSATTSKVNRNTTKKSPAVNRTNRNVTSRSTQPKITRENRASSNRSVISSRNNTPKRQDVIKTAPQKNDRRVTTNRNQVNTRNSSPTVNSGSSNDNSSRRDKSVTVNSGSNQNNSSNARRTTGINSRNVREKYRLDTNDKRYTPNNNYRGSKQVWSGSRRPASMNYNRSDRNYYRNYDYRTHKNWDRSWERYRWNFYSWRDYYHGYNPYSYRYHKYYYHDPVYGHVIRRFVYSPNIFIHNHNRYYAYDGHFFRFFRGVGYVLVDVPFGVTFDALPYGYERVYINGYLYFRVGNLFFEFSDFGFRLVHYPERYYAYDNGYINDGYYFDDDLYY